MTEQQQIEYLATKVMGWELCHHIAGSVWAKDERKAADYPEWSPLTNWNHWRQVEEKLIEDEMLFETYIYHVHQQSTGLDQRISFGLMKANLPTRVSAIISAYQDIYE